MLGWRAYQSSIYNGIFTTAFPQATTVVVSQFSWEQCCQVAVALSVFCASEHQHSPNVQKIHKSLDMLLFFLRELREHVVLNWSSDLALSMLYCNPKSCTM